MENIIKIHLAGMGFIFITVLLIMIGNTNAWEKFEIKDFKYVLLFIILELIWGCACVAFARYS